MKKNILKTAVVNETKPKLKNKNRTIKKKYKKKNKINKITTNRDIKKKKGMITDINIAD